MSPASTIHLPNSLILLVHLHILEYPHANHPEYDHNMFNSRTRGLRERAKTMEDITHFLIGKLERRSVKSILATYPCHQPVESLAFRTSLAKYLEGLRHQSIYAKGDATESAWWWKDVVVRKSLLEECSGDKFERLILSLSTHTLMRTSQALDPNMMSDLLRSQPLAYTSSLKRYQVIRHAWIKSASLLARAQSDFKALRDRLEAQTATKTTKYNAVPTVGLKTLVDLTFHELLQQRWTSDIGERALRFVIELAGLKLASSLPSLLSGSTDYGVGTSKSVAKIPSPLPIAAAHHPAHLKRFRRSVLQTKSNDTAGSDVPPIPLRSHAEIIMADYLDAEKQIHRTLVDALAKVQRRGSDTKARIDALMGAQAKPPLTDPPFWTLSNKSITPLNFAPQVGKQFMATLGLQADFAMLDPKDANEDTLEKKIEDIRRDVLPPYPPMPDLSAPRLAPRDFKPAAPKVSLPQNQPGGAHAPNSTVLKEPALAVPPAMSPGKSSRSIRRKSVRFSMANRRTSRPSMFRVFSGQVNDEVDRLVDETHDFTTDDEDREDEYSSPFKTPRGKGKPKVNRIWTAGTPASAMRSAAKPRQSTALALMLDGDPSMRLPSLSLSSSSRSMVASPGDDADSDEEVDPRDVDATPRPLRHGRQRQSSMEAASDEDVEDLMQYAGYGGAEAEADSDVYDDEAPSLTLKEILLSADTSHFDLLEMADDDMEEETLAADASFVWE